MRYDEYAALDGVGMASWERTLAVTARRGLIVSYGNAGGAVTGVNLGVLAAKGSLFLTRPTLSTYTAKRADMVASANSLFEAVETGKVEIVVNQHWPLHDAAEAHRALEARRNTGSTVFIPG